MRHLLSLLIALFYLPAALAIMDDEPLPADQAFVFSASTHGPDTLVVEWKIADGYYMYQDKLKFSTDTSGVQLGKPALPPGKIKQDEFFGEVTTYRKHIRVEIPVLRDDNSSNNGPLALQLTAQSQGCADLGICYPPQTHTALLNLPARDAPIPLASSAIGKLKTLVSGLGFGTEQQEFLPVEQAFAFEYEVRDTNTVIARWNIADGYYLYRDKIKARLASPGGQAGELTLPAGKIKNDEFFGRIETYTHNLEAQIPLNWDGPVPTSASLEISYQGCAESGICYPPVTKTLALSLPAAPAPAPQIQAAGPSSSPSSPSSTSAPLLAEQDRIAGILKDSSIWFTVLAFFGFGLLLSLTPCVFPMIPILSSIIVGQGEDITTRRAFSMSLVYVLAMALTYTAIGILAGLFGAELNLQATFQNPWILTGFSAVFVALSLSMFGFYDLQMPQFIQTKLSEVSNRQQGGTMAGIAVMGFLSALIVGPCVAAPLAGALIYIGQTGDAVLGGLALFALSMGMGAPLLAIGTSAGKILPRAGDWMNSIKAVFGVLLLAVAVWMLERILPTAVTMALWAVLLISSAIYLGALEPLGIDASGWGKFWKGMGMALLVYGVLMMIGAAAGSRDTLQPLRGVAFASAGTGTAQAEGLHFKRIKGLDGLQRELAMAAGRPVMLDFYADWCISCKELEKYTFSDPTVRQILADAVLLKADVTANNAADKTLLKSFKLIGPPAILFFDRNGQERRAHRLVGFMDASEFAPHARRALQP